MNFEFKISYVDSNGSVGVVRGCSLNICTVLQGSREGRERRPRAVFLFQSSESSATTIQ